MKKITVITLSLILVVCGVFAVSTRLSLHDYSNDEEKQNAALISGISSFIPGVTKYEEDEELGRVNCTVENLMKAELIAEVEPTGKTKWENGAGLCPLKVKKVFKGDAKVGSLIEFYETAAFTVWGDNDNVSFINQTLFSPMQEGKSYIIFAKKKDYHPLYEKALGKAVYVAVDLDVAWFRTDTTEPPVLSQKKEYTFGETKDLEFLCCSKKQRDGILAFKKAALFEVENLSLS